MQVSMKRSSCCCTLEVLKGFLWECQSGVELRCAERSSVSYTAQSWLYPAPRHAHCWRVFVSCGALLYNWPLCLLLPVVFSSTGLFETPTWHGAVSVACTACFGLCARSASSHCPPVMWIQSIEVRRCHLLLGGQEASWLTLNWVQRAARGCNSSWLKYCSGYVNETTVFFHYL